MYKLGLLGTSKLHSLCLGPCSFSALEQHQWVERGEEHAKESDNVIKKAIDINVGGWHCHMAQEGRGTMILRSIGMRNGLLLGDILGMKEGKGLKNISNS